MSGKKKQNSLKATITKVLPVILALLLAAAGYYFNEQKNGDNEGISIFSSEATAEITTAAAENTPEAEPTNTGGEETFTSGDIVVSTETSYDYYLTFYNDKLLDQHYEKHGKEMGFASPEDYERAANEVIFNAETLHKTEKEDGDDVYYLEDTNEFVVVSTSGYIRTYFLPDDGMAYYERQ